MATQHYNLSVVRTDLNALDLQRRKANTLTVSYSIYMCILIEPNTCGITYPIRMRMRQDENLDNSSSSPTFFIELYFFHGVHSYRPFQHEINFLCTKTIIYKLIKGKGNAKLHAHLAARKIAFSALSRRVCRKFRSKCPG